MTGVGVGTRPLGRKAPRPSHYEAGKHFVMLDLARHVQQSLPSAPDAVNLLAPWPKLYLGHNDQVSDCGAAGMANALSTQALREGRRCAFADLPNLDDAIRALYFEYTGGIDDGVVLLDFLRWLRDRKDGFLGEKIGEPVAVDPTNFEAVKFVLGVAKCPLYVGGVIVNAYADAQPGSFVRKGVGDWGVAGGHCRVVPGYITGAGQSFGEPNVSEESWAMDYYFPLSAWLEQTDEAYAIVDLARPSSAFDMETLRADVAALEAP